LVKPFHASLPEFQEHLSFDPFLEAVMGGGLGAQLGLVQGFPLAAGAQDVEDGVGAAAVWHAGASSPEAVRIHMLGEQGF
jgi:hypothetical protein